MGDRYELTLKCAYCNELNEEIWYAPTCGLDGFTCSKCGKYNFIKNFRAVKRKDITAKDLFDEFMAVTIVVWSNDDIERIKKKCKCRLKQRG